MEQPNKPDPTEFDYSGVEKQLLIGVDPATKDSKTTVCIAHKDKDGSIVVDTVGTVEDFEAQFVEAPQVPVQLAALLKKSLTGEFALTWDMPRRGGRLLMLNNLLKRMGLRQLCFGRFQKKSKPRVPRKLKKRIKKGLVHLVYYPSWPPKYIVVNGPSLRWRVPTALDQCKIVRAAWKDHMGVHQPPREGRLEVIDDEQTYKALYEGNFPLDEPTD